MKRLFILLTAAMAFAATLATSGTRSADPLVAAAGVAIVDTTAGKIQGFVHRGIYTYRGVPYAQAVRFMPPEHPAHWDGVRTATAFPTTTA